MKKNLNQKLINLIEYYNLINANFLLSNTPLKRTNDNTTFTFTGPKLERLNQLKKKIYKYNKNNWLHAWGNIMPYHYDNGDEFSYHNFIEDDQWYDYSGGLIYGIKVNKNLGYFFEGKYNKYWNREWYDFKCGVNYVIF